MEATRFLRRFSDVEIYHGYFPQCIKNTDEFPFDFAYMNATEYVFNENELIKLLTDIKDYGVKNFLLVSASTYNGRFAPLRLIKDTVKSMLSLIGLYEVGQFWGYTRTPDELANAFKEVGCAKIEMALMRETTFSVEGEL